MNLSKKNGNRIWIAWERQRRTIELAAELNCKLYIIEESGIARYPISILKTLKIFFRERVGVLFVQNPSMILAALACIYGLLKGIPVIVDRHSTFRLNKLPNRKLRTMIFNSLNKFTIKHACITIVTNDYLAKIVLRLSGNPLVLPDKLPFFPSFDIVPLRGSRNIFLISSFADDEPILEAIQAVSQLEDDDICLYISGDYRKFDSRPSSLPENVIFTGFLKEQDFINLLHSVDVVMVLTTADWTMLCGCYEAIAAEKPLITSDKKVLKDYFIGCVYVGSDPRSISSGIVRALSDIEGNRVGAKELKAHLTSDWNDYFMDLEKQLDVV